MKIAHPAKSKPLSVPDPTYNLQQPRYNNNNWGAATCKLGLIYNNINSVVSILQTTMRLVIEEK